MSAETADTRTGETSPTPYQLLPRLTDEEYEALKADIAEHGIRVPIDVDEDGTILDGHHRAWIAADLGVQCPRRVVAGLTDEAKRAHSIAANVYRRQLNREQRQEMVARLREQGMSTRQIAKAAQVDHSTVVRDLPAVRPGADTPRRTEPTQITGRDGKTYQPQTLDQRRQLAADLRTQGLSVGQIAERMGVAKSSAQTLLAPRKSSAPRVPVGKDRESTATRIAMARELAASGHTSSQIAARLGMSEGGFKNLRGKAGISVPADAVVGSMRRLNANRVVEETVRSAEVPSSLLDAIDYAALDRALIGEWISSLSESMKALRSLKTALEKELNRVTG